MLKLITLDLDNTLWNVTPTLIRAEKTLASWIQKNIPNATKYYQKDNLLALRKEFNLRYPEKKHFPTEVRKHILEKVFLQAGIHHNDTNGYVEEAFSIFIKERNNIDLFPETLNILETLSKQYIVIALTNGNADLSLIGIQQFFKAHFSAESTGKAKPDPTMFNQALSSAGCKPEQTLHIGDHPVEDIEAANSLGLHTIWFNHQGKNDPTLCKPTVEIQSLDLLLHEVEKIHLKDA